MNSVKNIIKNRIFGNVFIRKLYYFYLTLTTLTEWHVKPEIKKIMKHWDGKKKVTVLDAGSGFGQYSYYFARRFPDMEITAVEKDSFRINGLRDFAQKNGLKICCIQSDLLSLDSQKKFDLILCTDILEHITEDKKLVEIFHKALKPGGKLLLGVPTSPQRRVLKFLKHRSWKMEPEGFGHIREGYPMDEISALLTSVGFRIEKKMYSFGILGALAYEIFYIVQAKPVFFVVFSPVYFLLVHPFMLILMYIDRLKHHRIGNGIIVVAKKTND